ncbi:MAG: FHA domain-containing protein [Oscillospiraceae bacterium]|nr:FHA domain-containing protein [Oscillospiraceae bacterium]
MESVSELLSGLSEQIATFKGFASVFVMLFIDLCVLIILLKSGSEKKLNHRKWRREFNYIAVVEGQRIIPVENSEILLGRHRSADIQFPDMSVSRYHAVLTYSDGVFLLEDLNSKSGTYLNGKKIKSAVINIGDEIKLGAVVFHIKKIKEIENVRRREKRKNKA